MVEIYELVAQMKDLVQCNPEQARSILLGHPQLAQALLQAQVMLGMMNNAIEGGQTQSELQKQQDLLRQVRQMTPEMISALPLEQQQQVKQLRQADQLSR